MAKRRFMPSFLGEFIGAGFDFLCKVTNYSSGDPVPFVGDAPAVGSTSLQVTNEYIEAELEDINGLPVEYDIADGVVRNFSGQLYIDSSSTDGSILLCLYNKNGTSDRFQIEKRPVGVLFRYIGSSVSKFANFSVVTPLDEFISIDMTFSDTEFNVTVNGVLQTPRALLAGACLVGTVFLNCYARGLSHSISQWNSFESDITGAVNLDNRLQGIDSAFLIPSSTGQPFKVVTKQGLSPYIINGTDLNGVSSIAVDC
jgi:hypothetical protein